MDFLKFVDLLRTSELYLRRLDLLGDPHEGKVETFAALVRRMQSPEEASLRANLEDFLTRVNTLRTYVYVNCWHISKRESMGMWRVYGGAGYGLAITSTVRRLESAIDPTGAEHFLIGKVTYGKPVFLDWMYWATQKRAEYAYERELRVLATRFPTANVHVAEGMRLPVNLHKMIDEVVIAPDAPSMLRDSVVAVSKKFGVDLSIRVSSLAAKPSF